MGPNYHRPAANLPAQFPGAPAIHRIDRRQEVVRAVSGRTSSSWSTTALEQNFDVRIAAERVLEARAQYGITRADLFPTLDAQAQFTATRNSSIGSFPFIPPGTQTRRQLHAGRSAVSWELDLWGRCAV